MGTGHHEGLSRGDHGVGEREERDRPVLMLHRPARGRSHTPTVSTIRGNRRPHRGLALLLVAVTVVAVAAVCAVRTYRVHEAGWEWRLTPSAAPPKVHFAGRDYERGSLDGAHPPLSYVRQGTTPGGGVI